MTAPTDWQDVAALLVVALATAHVTRILYRNVFQAASSTGGSGCGTGCGSCATTTHGSSPQPVNFVTLDAIQRVPRQHGPHRER